MGSGARTVLVAGVVLVAVLVAEARRAGALRCIRQSAGQQWARHQVVFVGRVLGRHGVANYSVKVMHWIKGLRSGEYVSVHNPGDAVGGGMKMRVGEVYLVFANWRASDLVVSLCGPTTRVDDVDTALYLSRRPSADPGDVALGGMAETEVGDTDVDAAAIERIDAPNLSDILLRVPGFHLAHGGIAARGRTDWLAWRQDGIDLRSRLLGDAVDPMWDLLDVRTLARAEIMRGPRAIRNAADSLGGAVDLRSPSRHRGQSARASHIGMRFASVGRGSMAGTRLDALYGPHTFFGSLAFGLGAAGHQRMSGDLGIQRRTHSGDISLYYSGADEDPIGEPQPTVPIRWRRRDFASIGYDRRHAVPWLEQLSVRLAYVAASQRAAAAIDHAVRSRRAVLFVEADSPLAEHVKLSLRADSEVETIAASGQPPAGESVVTDGSSLVAIGASPSLAVEVVPGSTLLLTQRLELAGARLPAPDGNMSERRAAPRATSIELRSQLDEHVKTRVVAAVTRGPSLRGVAASPGRPSLSATGARPVPAAGDASTAGGPRAAVEAGIRWSARQAWVEAVGYAYGEKARDLQGVEMIAGARHRRLTGVVAASWNRAADPWLVLPRAHGNACASYQGPRWGVGPCAAFAVAGVNGDDYVTIGGSGYWRFDRWGSLIVTVENAADRNYTAAGSSAPVHGFEARIAWRLSPLESNYWP